MNIAIVPFCFCFYLKILQVFSYFPSLLKIDTFINDKSKYIKALLQISFHNFWSHGYVRKKKAWRNIHGSISVVPSIGVGAGECSHMYSYTCRTFCAGLGCVWSINGSVFVQSKTC